MHASFHFPLHRYLAAFISQAVRVMGMPLVEVLPDQEMLSLLMMHPLRVQVSALLAILWNYGNLYILYSCLSNQNCVTSILNVLLSHEIMHV